MWVHIISLMIFASIHYYRNSPDGMKVKAQFRVIFFLAVVVACKRSNLCHSGDPNHCSEHWILNLLHHTRTPRITFFFKLRIVKVNFLWSQQSLGRLQDFISNITIVAFCHILMELPALNINLTIYVWRLLPAQWDHNKTYDVLSNECYAIRTF